MNLSLAIAIMDANLKGPTATFDERGLMAVRSAWLAARDVLTRPSSGEAERERIARIIDPEAWDEITAEDNEDGKAIFAEPWAEALAKVDAILSVLEGDRGSSSATEHTSADALTGAQHSAGPELFSVLKRLLLILDADQIDMRECEKAESDGRSLLAKVEGLS